MTAETPDRRRFLGLAAGLSFAAFGAGTAAAQEAEQPDPRLTVETVTFQVRRQVFKGQLSRPRSGGRRPAVLLIHGQRGADALHRAFARRLALDGFLVLLPDLASPQGISADQVDEIQGALARLAPAEVNAALEAGIDLVAKHPECNGAIGVVGFSWGGTFALQLAAASQRLRAAVSFYAVPPSPEHVAAVRVPILFHWADNDPRTAPLVDAIEKRLIGSGKVFEAYLYAGVVSGFATDPDPRRYDQKATDRAYERTAFFLRRWLVAPA